MQRIAIVDPHNLTREALRSLLLGVSSVRLEVECARYEFFLDVVYQTNPDAVIVSLDADCGTAVRLIAQLHDEYPDLPILAASSDDKATLRALHRGAKFFVTQPVEIEELRTALQRIPAAGPTASVTPEPTTPADPHGCQVIAVLGSRGGVGCTSLAVNLGCTLASDPAHSVVLVDLDLALGDADLALDLINGGCLGDVDFGRLDLASLKRSLVRHPRTGLRLLAHPMQMHDVGPIGQDHLPRLLDLLRANHTHLILDLSKGLTTDDLTALRAADIILLVAQLEVSSLRTVSRMLPRLRNESGLSHKVRIVLNKVGLDFSEGRISAKTAEEALGKPIYAQIPNDPKAMTAARNAGLPLIQIAPQSKVQTAVHGLAAALIERWKAAAPGT